MSDAAGSLFEALAAAAARGISEAVDDLLTPDANKPAAAPEVLCADCGRDLTKPVCKCCQGAAS